MSAPDHSNIVSIEKRMKDACKKLHSMESDVGMAVTVIDYDTERRKALLARYAAPALKSGESATAADTHARADARYDKELQQLLGQYQEAQVTMKKYEIEKISWETARSLLSMQRESLKTMPDQ